MKLFAGMLAMLTLAISLTACGNNKESKTKKAPEKLPTYSQISKKAEQFKDYKDFHIISKNKDNHNSEKLEMRFTLKPYAYYIYSRDIEDSVLEVWNINNTESYMKQNDSIVKTTNPNPSPSHAMNKKKFTKLLKQMGKSFEHADVKALKWKISQNKNNYILTYNCDKPNQKKIKDYICNDRRIGLSMKQVYGTVRKAHIQYFVDKKNYAINKVVSTYEIVNANNIAKVSNYTALNDNIDVTVPKAVKKNATEISGVN